MMKKVADGSLLGNRVFINSKKGTQSVPTLTEPIYELSIDDSPEQIGEKVGECIEAYQPGSERYDREKWKTVNDPLIKLAGEKDSKAFFTKVKNPSVVLLGDVLHFSPRDNHGWKEGFKKTEHPNIELDYTKATNEDLGNALLKAFELSSIK
jgi:predicted nucleotide-binding protein (sugar kinase/HSP70/actin superfamily)